MNPTQDLSILSLITGASIPVQLIMLVLFLMSLTSWSFIFSKFFGIRRAKQQTIDFESNFWSGVELSNLYEVMRRKQGDHGPTARIFQAGFDEFNKGIKNRNVPDNNLIDSARRAMRAAYQREMDALDAHLNFLASTASVSVYIGLFGTVWGIMNSFRGLANVQQATLASVAPGIAEALVATAIGLFAAIPAFVAYNSFSHDIDRLSIRFESFIDEFLNILQRQVR